MGGSTAHFILTPPPWGRGQKVKYHQISITKTVSKLLEQNFVCRLTNKRYKTYQTGLKDTGRGQISPSIILSLLNHSTKFGMLVTPINGACNRTFLWPRPLGPCGWVKRSNIIKFHLQSQFERLLYRTFYVFSQIKDIKHTEQDFHLVAWVMPQGRDWVLEGSKVKFFRTWSCGISN